MIENNSFSNKIQQEEEEEKQQEEKNENENDYIEITSTCPSCWSSISEKALFCNMCGFIQIKNKYILEKTTAQYDPGSKQLKPWREEVHLANNSWKNRNLNVLVTKREPWRPCMNQKNVYLKKGKGKPSKVPWPKDQKSSIENDQTNLNLKDSKNINFQRLNSKRVIHYRGRYWSKSGDVYKKKKTIFSSEMMFGMEPKNKKIDEDSQSDVFISISLYPLGIYSLDWIVLTNYEVKIHITLLRRFFQSKYHHLLSMHWLRIEYEIEPLNVNKSDSDNNSLSNSQNETNLYIIAYLPNSIAKCLGASIQGDWVDLQYIDPSHTYMMNHLQIALTSIADRVIPIIDENDKIFDQTCRIFMESIGTHFQDEENNDDDHLFAILNDSNDSDSKLSESILHNPKQPLLKRIHSMVDDTTNNHPKKDEENNNNNNENENGDNSDDGDNNEDEDESESEIFDDNDNINSKINSNNNMNNNNLNKEKKFKFNPFIAKVVHGIPVGAYYLNRKVMSTVFLEILWKHDDNSVENYIYDENNHSQQDNDNDDNDNENNDDYDDIDESISNQDNSSSNKQNKKLENDWLTKIPFITGVLLKIYPTYYDGVLLKPKMLSIHVDSLADLITCEKPKLVKNNYDNNNENKNKNSNNGNSSNNDNEDNEDNGDPILRYGDNINPASQHILRLLEKGSIGAKKLCNEILEIIRFEYTTEGLRLFVHGVDSNYIICDTPEEMERKIEEKENASIIIQSAWRGKLGRDKAREMREIKDRLNQHQKNYASTQIQKIARGYICRKHYKEILQAILLQKKELERQASIHVETTEILEIKDESELIELPLIIEMKGTEVEISLVSQNEISTKSFCDSKVIVTDIISKKSTSVLIPSNILGRFWNLFKRVPIKFDEAILRIHRLKLTDLKQVDIIGKNDPYVKLSYSNTWTERTETIEEGGTDVEWIISNNNEKQSKFQIFIKSTELNDKCLEVSIYDENQLRSDVLIGEVSINLNTLLSITSFGEEITLTREIKRKGKSTGYITVVCDIVKKNQNNTTTIVENIVTKSTIHSLFDLLQHKELKVEFLEYLAKNHLDLFFSRSSDVMILRMLN